MKAKINENKGFWILLVISFLATIWVIHNTYSDISFHSLAGNYLGVVTLLLIIMVVLALLFSFIWKIDLWKQYVMIGIFAELAMMLLLPPGAVPDEPVHINTSFYQANLMMGIDETETGIMMRDEDTVNAMQNYGLAGYRSVAEMTSYIDRMDDSIESNSYHSVELPLLKNSNLYMIPATGIVIGRLLNLGTFPCLFLGRLLNTIFFVCMGAYAVHKIPVGKRLLMVVLLLPMTLQQGMSFSYDVLINGLSFVLVSLALKWFYTEQKPYFTKSEFVIALISSVVLLIPEKGKAYFLLSLLPWLILLIKKWNPSRKTVNTMLVSFFVLVGISIAGMFLWNATGASSVAWKPNILTYTGEAVDGYSFSYLLANPIDLLKLFYFTIKIMGEFYIASMISTPLGWLDLCSSYIFVIIFILFMIWFALKRKNEKIVIGNRMRVSLLILSGLTIAFVFGGLLLSWTPIDCDYILGIQGRYFLPILVMLMLILHCTYVQVPNKYDNYIFMSFVLTLFMFIGDMMIRLM